jgi:hypothetical protein
VESLTFTETLGELNFSIGEHVAIAGMTFSDSLGSVGLQKNLSVQGMTFTETMGSIDFIEGYATITVVDNYVDTDNRYDTSSTLAPPTNLQDGDLLVCVMGCARQETWTLPSGWNNWCTPMQIGAEGDKITHQLAYKVASSESGNYTFTVTTASNMSLGLFALRGVDTSTIWDVTPNHTTHHIKTLEDTTPPVPGLTTNTDGAVVLQCSWAGRYPTGISTDQSGATELWEIIYNNANQLCHIETVSTAGAYSACTHTYAGAVSDMDSVSLVVAFKPGAA